MGIGIAILDFYFLFYEFYGFVRDGWGYISEIENYVDAFGSVLNLILVIFTLKDDELGDGERYNIRTLASIAVILMWTKALYWMRLFGSFSSYVRLIRATLWDIKYFVILFLIILSTFGNALMILDQGRMPEEKLIEKIFGMQFFDAFMNQYMLSLGEFATGSFQLEGRDQMAWILFILSTFIT